VPFSGSANSASLIKLLIRFQRRGSKPICPQRDIKIFVLHKALIGNLIEIKSIKIKEAIACDKCIAIIRPLEIN